jgi:hypothetical protein
MSRTDARLERYSQQGMMPPMIFFYAVVSSHTEKVR